MYRSLTFTEAGGHVTNEDVFRVEWHPENSSYCICVLADGQGGQPSIALALPKMNC